MKKIIIAIFTILIFSNSVEAKLNSPKDTIENISKNVFDTLKNDKTIISNEIELDKLIEKELMPNIDVSYISLKILGKNIKKYKRSEIKSFISHMKPYMKNIFKGAFKFYNEQDLKIYYNKDVKMKNQKVKVEVIEEGKNTTLVFYLRKNKKNQWKIYDLVAEGISLLSSKQSEFSKITRQGDINKLINAVK